MENLELYQRICEAFREEAVCIEMIDFVEVDGKKYTYAEEAELDTIDEGKYQYGGRIYAIGEVEDCNDFDIKEPLFYIEQDFVQTGSYYSEQYKEYDSAYIVEPVEVKIMEWKPIK